MKKYISLLVGILSCIMVQAQTDSKSSHALTDQDTLQTLFCNTGRLGWWVAPEFAWTQIEDRDAFMFGFSGGIIIKHSFSFGLAGCGFMNSQNLNYSGINDTTDVFLYGGYGGFKMEYRINPLKMINIAFPLLIGGGGVSYSTWDPYDWHHNYEEIQFYTWDSYFVLEPGVVFGINLLKFMRLDIGGSYRYAPGVELPKTKDDFLNGFNFVSSLKFGRF